MALRGGAALLKRPLSCSIALSRHLHDLPPDSYLSKPKLENARKGRGGRSSFSGVVATVFGGYGSLGPHVIGLLGRSGTQMIIPYRCYEIRINELKPAGDLGQLIFTPLSVRDDENIRQAVKYSNVVINLIGKDYHSRNFTMEETNVDIPRRIARISKEMNVEKFIHVSHINAGINFKPYYLKEGSEFLRTKTAGERAVQEEFPEATIIRPSSMFAYDDKFIAYYATKERRNMFGAMQLPNSGKGIFVQPVYMGNVADAIELCIHAPETNGEIIEAVGPRRYELRDLVAYIGRMTTHPEANQIVDLTRYSPYHLFAFACGLISYHPRNHISPDRVERDSHSDITQGHRTIEELGVNLRRIETVVEDACQDYRYDEELKDTRPIETKDILPKAMIPKKALHLDNVLQS